MTNDDLMKYLETDSNLILSGPIECLDNQSNDIECLVNANNLGNESNSIRKSDKLR